MAPSPDEARTMWDLLGMADHIAATFVFNYPTPSGWTAEVGRELGTEPATWSVPLQFSSGLRFVKRFVLTRGPDAPRMRAKPLQIELAGTGLQNSVVLRAKTRKELHSGWGAVVTSPGKQLRAWADAVITGKPPAIRDTWGWELRTDEAQGLVRVDAASAEALLRASGVAHKDCRWFLEPLRWEAPLPANMRAAPATSWVAEPSLVKAAAKAEQEAKAHGLGVRLGSFQVGYRWTPAEGPDGATSRRRLWKLLGLDPDFCEEDVRKLALSAGFAEIEISERFRFRGKFGWSFKGTRQDDFDHLDLQVNNRTVLASCAMGRGDRRGAIAMPSEQTVRFSAREAAKGPATAATAGDSMFRNPAGFKAKTSDADASKQPDGSAMDTQEPSANETEAADPASAGQKRGHSSPKQGLKKARRGLIPSGLRALTNEGQGNCLFHALSDAFQQVNVSRGHMVLRTLAVSHLRRYEAAYAPAWDRLKPDGTNTSMKEGEFSQYLDLVAKEGAWGSALEITAVANGT
eukprot:s14130_g1.t1